MSEIPFVNRLGDAIEAAVTAFPGQHHDRRRRRRRQGLAVVLAALLTAGGGVALAGLFSDPAQMATTGVSCYETPDRQHGMLGIYAGDRSPALACAHALRTLGKPVPALVACDPGKGGVVVFPGRDARACAREGLRALPPQYTAERARARALEHALLALEARADCIPPRTLATRVQTLLRRSGWTGWRPWLRLDITHGPCGRVSEYGGDGERSVGASLAGEQGRVMVFAGARRSTEALLNGRGGIGGPLFEASGKRCYTQAELRALVRRRLTGTGRSVRFSVSPPDDSVMVQGPRGARLAEGCAIIASVEPARDGLNVVVRFSQRD
jgi:hypothetical protein